MSLSLNELRDKAIQFSNEWKDESSERAEAQTFWNEFFEIFGIKRRRFASFEVNSTSEHRKNGRIDLLWKGHILVEHKSLGSDLKRAHQQAIDYFPGIKDTDLPKLIVVCDFQNFSVLDIDDNEKYEFPLAELYKNIKLFSFILGYQKPKSIKAEDPVNRDAAELMGKLHDQLSDSGYEGHQLEVYLVRLLFCLFADDTSIFNKDAFKDLIDSKTKENGSDLGSLLGQYFEVLNTPLTSRQRTLDSELKNFPYINGKLFEEHLSTAAFDSGMRKILLECSDLNWSKISPAIFGSMFQSVMDPEKRRNIGAHYTSEKNILRLIKPLFLDELYDEFEKVKNSKVKLKEFHKKLSSLKFLDPACGCGNFLVITYRELRLLELEVLRILQKDQQSFSIDSIIWLDVDQFYGIEYEEWPARISEVALWLMDHQMNMIVSQEFGQYFSRVPLRKSATIIHGNALRENWTDIINPKNLNYILGNPPFYGKQLQTVEQKKDMAIVFDGVKQAGVLDYVTAWYLKAAQYIHDYKIKIALVSTNSISQGEQVGILWSELFNNYNIKINFAHRTFKWDNDAKGIAAVHVIIIGFANYNLSEKYLFEYSDIKAEPLKRKVKNINPYLVESNNFVIQKRRKPLTNVPEISFGSMPNDGGNFLFTDEEKKHFIKIEPGAKKFIKPLLSAKEYLNGSKRWCLWLENIEPKELRKLKEIQKRVSAVAKLRRNSTREATRKLAQYPTLFGENRQPDSEYVYIPLNSSENRKYIPMAFFGKGVIANNTGSLIPNSSLFHFGILSSKMHMVWVNYTCGRIKSDYRYSNEIVYNNYPWPSKPSDKNKEKVKTIAQKLLKVRDELSNNTLADLYDPSTMPPKLVKVHKELDKAVDLCYRPQFFPSEVSRMEYLFFLYEQYTEGLFKPEKYKGRKKTN